MVPCRVPEVTPVALRWIFLSENRIGCYLSKISQGKAGSI